MTHVEIVKALNDLQDQMELPDMPWVGFGRVLEALVDIAEHSNDQLVHATFEGLHSALLAGENAGTMVVKDYVDSTQKDVATSATV